MGGIYDNDAFFAAYAGMDRSRRGLEGAGEWHQLRPLFPPLEGKAVLDLGCGYGWHCRYAVQQGAAQVTGIDCSEKMIAVARERNCHPRIRYQVCSLEGFPYPEAAYDLVVSNLVLHYVEDLEAVYGKVHRTLKAGGIFLLNIEHPVFTAGVNQQWVLKDGAPLYWPVDNYFYPGERNTLFLGREVV